LLGKKRFVNAEFKRSLQTKISLTKNMRTSKLYYVYGYFSAMKERVSAAHVQREPAFGESRRQSGAEHGSGAALAEHFL